ncbi:MULTISPECIES: PspA/IM30 family protein [Peribacillus]|uniref:PspA/IM30 family protein n=1 Tax=Peribacillus TaxID=2675229 RepID=UPI0019129B89|nr:MULTISPECIES: PspA/IM30 family protein [unclassified Peribacillus]MBK5443187.1 PspA/IM30 family protein [Peribacillus sp. TH24]MBK5500227.1 PspA/IM30 family protein [Peribacillus sp. TH14]WMX54740.1 PspA/IM30 family protein [Peribacillus sp. R9-11]
MSNLFSRMKQTISADFHDLLDKKEQKNPIGMLNQYLRQCEQEAEKVGKLVERQYLLKEEFTREYSQAQNLAEKRKHQAEIAKQAGEIDLMEFALKENLHYEDRVLSLKEAQKSAEVQLDELERKYEEMKHKLKDMHLKRMELMGRENIARANHRINRVLNAGSSDAKPIAKFDEMEQYIDRIENQVHSDYNRHTIDARIVQLEKEMEQKEA